PSTLPTLFPYTTLFRSDHGQDDRSFPGREEQFLVKDVVVVPNLNGKRIGPKAVQWRNQLAEAFHPQSLTGRVTICQSPLLAIQRDRKSTRLNSSHVAIS